jgi:hypothetical protein
VVGGWAYVLKSVKDRRFGSSYVSFSFRIVHPEINCSCSLLTSALGVGVKVVDPPDPESTFRQKQPPFELAGPLSVDLLASRAQTQAMSTNIMQTLMNQGQYICLHRHNHNLINQT